MRARGYETWVVTAALLWAGCATGGGGLDGGNAGRADAGRTDASLDDGGPVDAGAPDASRAAGIPVDAQVDSGTLDAGTFDAGPSDAGHDAGHDAGQDAGPPLCPPTSDRVAIVEVMIASDTGAGDRGEWIELINAGDCTVDLGGLELASPIGGAGSTAIATYTISAGRTLAQGARIVLAQSANPTENRGLAFDEAYTSLVFDNIGDWVELRSGGATIDRVEWLSNDIVHGASRRFPDARPISDNGIRSAWCTSTALYSTAGGNFYGTPRTGNGSCP